MEELKLTPRRYVLWLRWSLSHNQGRAESYRKVGHIESIHIASNQQMPCFLQNNEERQEDGVDDGVWRSVSAAETVFAQALLLLMPREWDVLYLYLAISEWATSAVIVREEAGVQYPVYYTNKLNAKTRYSKMEKWVLVLVMVARKLRPYFQHI